MKKLLFVISLVLVFLLIYQGHFMLPQSYRKGWQAGYDAYEPKIITEIETITKTEIIEIEIIREVPVLHEVREFDNMGELRQFLRNLDIQGHKQPDWDCDDFAYYVWIEAHKQGYLMSFESEWKGEVLHALNSTIIGNRVYHIEPQTGMNWLFGYLD